MKIKVKYFAAIREAIGINEEFIDGNSSTPLELFEFLKEKYRFEFEESNIKVAINDEYAEFTQPLSELDTIVFIPPVAGG